MVSSTNNAEKPGDAHAKMWICTQTWHPTQKLTPMDHGLKEKHKI